MSIRRVALIFDDRLRPDTTGTYVRRSLAGLADVVHFQPSQRDLIPGAGFDLYLSIDDDTDHRLPSHLQPLAYWAIDTHRDFVARLERSRSCDIVFAAQRDGSERLRSAGIESASWLPLACDPEIHRPHEVPKRHDVAFVGNQCPGPRNELLGRIVQQFANHFIGRAYFGDMARIYSASRIVFNRSIGNDVNMRVFEAVACGSLLVTNDLAENGQAELFQDGVHLATYQDAEEMLEKIRHYLEHDDRREAIASAGRAEAIARHTYRHRMGRLLAEAETRLGRTVAAGVGPGRDGTWGVNDGPRMETLDCLGPESGHPRPAQKVLLEGGTPPGEGQSQGWSSAFRRSDTPDKIPLEGGTPAGQGQSRGCVAGLTSIIVPCWNQLEFTRHCLRSLFQHTTPAWELIVVDNGSTDGTADYLAGVQVGGRVPVTIVQNTRNRGFPAAINQGLRASRGEYLVLLNNDAVVTDLWLEHLIALTKARPESNWETSRPHEGEAGRPVPSAIAVDGGVSGLAHHTGAVESGDPRLERRAIGLVGPVSNYVSPPQWIESVPYHDLEEMHEFARRWREENLGKWFTVTKLSGFCLLMTRAVLEAVGGLDEQFGLGLFDDDDLAERARRAGFELAVALDVFVHHFGSRTFVGNGIDAEALLQANERRFADKWGHDRPRGRRVALQPWNGHSESHAATPSVDAKGAMKRRMVRGRHPSDQSAIATPDSQDVTDRPLNPTGQQDHRGSVQTAVPPLHPREKQIRSARVTLTMIVRDEENNLPRCLESVRGIFDEIVVVDTGSVDRTAEIAREFGARIFDFVWVDDFAAARNAALARARGDYAFWLDADDVIEPPEREKLRALLDGLRPGDETACVVRCACDPGEDGSGGDTVVDHIRVFPLREEVRWTYRVHEQILPALRRAGIPVRWTDLVVRHTGYVDRALRARKLDRDRRILQEEVQERPQDPFILFNLGSIAIERREWREALGLFHRSLAGSAPSDSITRKLYALIARAHQMLHEPEPALAACAAGLAMDPNDAEILFREAVLRRQIGDPKGAERCWRRILTLRRPEQFASLDQGIYGHLTRRNLAALARERGDHAEAARLWAEVLRECPGDPEALAAASERRCKTSCRVSATIMIPAWVLWHGCFPCRTGLRSWA